MLASPLPPELANSADPDTAVSVHSHPLKATPQPTQQESRHALTTADSLSHNVPVDGVRGASEADAVEGPHPNEDSPDSVLQYIPLPTKSNGALGSTASNRDSSLGQDSFYGNSSSQVNPLYNLSERVKEGKIGEVHVLKVKEHQVEMTDKAIPSGTQRFGRGVLGYSFNTPKSPKALSPIARLNNQLVNGKPTDDKLHNGSPAATGSASTSSPSKRQTHDEDSIQTHSRRTKENGTTLTLEPDGEYEGEQVQNFTDHEVQSSKRDQARMAAHEWKSGIKDKMSGITRERSSSRSSKSSIEKGKGKETISSSGNVLVENALARTSSLDQTASQIHSQDHAFKDSHSSENSGEVEGTERRLTQNASNPALLSALSASPQKDSGEVLKNQRQCILSSSTESLPLCETPPSFNPPVSSSMAQSTSAISGLNPNPMVQSSPPHLPVFNAPGFVVTNSRLPPGSSPINSSTRLVPIDSLTRPLALPALEPSTSIVSISSRGSGGMSGGSGSIRTGRKPASPRRSNTSPSLSQIANDGQFTTMPGSPGRPPSGLSNQQYFASRSPGSPAREAGKRNSANLMPMTPTIGRVRAHTYFEGDPNALRANPAGLEMDDVETSIAAQADVIRRERQNKRLEQEKELLEQSQTAVVSSGTSPRLRAPSTNRRNTRTPSGDDATALGYEKHVPIQGDKAKVAREEAPGAGVLVGNLIGQDHANYVLMYNMLTGIRIGVSRCQAKLKRPLTDADYTARHKFSFDIVGNELTPSTKYDFKFKDYAPWVFRELREYFYLDPSDYLVSLTAKYILSELGSPGKSGSFFYFSRDYRFIIKTIRHAEHKFLRSILKEYHEYIKGNPHTLLSRFYGLHRVKLPRGRKIHFVIMNNLFPPHRDIHETYDLKGSAIGRLYPEEKAKDNPRAILKDLNWVTRHRQLALGPEKKALFEEQLRRDTMLMQKLGIMDYSLLTGIHNVVRGNVDNLRDGMLTVFQPDTVKVRRKPTQLKRDADTLAVRKAVQRSDPKALSEANALPDQETSERRMFLFYQDEGGIRATGGSNEDLGMIYYLGVIDILTPYSCIKRLEHVYKGLKFNKHMISAVPPKEYGDRFLAFLFSVIRGNDSSKRPRMFESEIEEEEVKEKEVKEKAKQD